MSKHKTYQVGSTVQIEGLGEGVIIKKKCWQCGSKLAEGESKFSKWEACPNNCGPESLGKMFQF